MAGCTWCLCCAVLQGVYVTYVYEGGPAHQAGLQVHDKLLQVGHFSRVTQTTCF